MTPAKKPAPLPSNADEARRTNLLLESLQDDLGAVAEGVVDLQRKMTGMAAQSQATADDVAVMKPIVQQNTRDIAEIKAGIGRIERKLTSFDRRLTTVEQKVAA